MVMSTCALSDLELFDHPYNTTILNERAVELAVARRWLDERQGDGLEVGNVTSHYWAATHRIVDLYEQAEGVENVDLFTVEDRFDWVLAISTVEHVRWDDAHDPSGGPAAVQHLRSLLKPEGQLLVTIPFGWNPPLDQELPLGADWWQCWQRAGNDWEMSDAEPVGYGPRWANKVFVGVWRAA
jgi:SAM-dependent methyltransferase